MINCLESMRPKHRSITEMFLIASLALLIGLVVGALDFIFGSVLLVLSDFRDDNLLLTLPFLPFVGLFIIFIYQHFGQGSDQGMSLIFDLGQGRKTELPKALIPLVILSTWLTHLFGGSAGREGVAVQIGAGVAYYGQKMGKIPNASRLFIICGMAAGFSGLFQTPMAASLFALEVLVLDRIPFKALLPVVIASFTASFSSHYLGLEKFSMPLGEKTNLNPQLMLKLVLLGLIFGLVGNLFALGLKWLKGFLAQKLANPYQRIFLLGLTLSLALFLLFWGRYSGLGTNLISLAFRGQEIYAYDWLLKLGLTIVTIVAGFQGGEVTPLFAIGASLGSFLGPYFGISYQLAAALGYCAVFSSATNTFFAPIFIGLEVFGPNQISSIFIVVAFSYMLNREVSIYGKQKGPELI
ncbi:chloride channel protein [Streptococcus didelphis]|uniref:Chloride channel protein n=1 Tax=Streptococcus didelphis TaxID=102886 RepID=A0ABY9LJX2_9STRE|nr:chloride channel protein [Streptococcus didelphis]WMB28406.1 chloride channel protein [Streptococcus didelphis]